MDRTNLQLNAAFAEVLRRRRSAAGLTQEELAERSEVSTRHISFLETGRRQPTLTIIVALCDGLGITFAEFAGDIETAWTTMKGLRAQE